MHRSAFPITFVCLAAATSAELVRGENGDIEVRQLDWYPGN